jgi:hypothetical protein
MKKLLYSLFIVFIFTVPIFAYEESGGATTATSIAAEDITTGKLPPDVIASSVAANTVYPAAVSPGTYSNITLPADNITGAFSNPQTFKSSITVNADIESTGTVKAAGFQTTQGVEGGAFLLWEGLGGGANYHTCKADDTLDEDTTTYFPLNDSYGFQYNDLDSGATIYIPVDTNIIVTEIRVINMSVAASTFTVNVFECDSGGDSATTILTSTFSVTQGEGAVSVTSLADTAIAKNNVLRIDLYEPSGTVNQAIVRISYYKRD